MRFSEARFHSVPVPSLVQEPFAAWWCLLTVIDRDDEMDRNHSARPG